MHERGDSMKFGDKLIELRKKNGLSQEELAEKLGVSRQSVSKWESNNTYPETDKIIQIANLFDCSMDDLINDKITDVEASLRKNKNNIQYVWDSFIEFITNTVNMVSKMTFMQGLKLVLEFVVLGFILNIIGSFICNTVSSLIANVFTFISLDVVHVVKSLLLGITNLIWAVIAIIILIHVFKLRYFNDYQKEVEKEEEEKKQNQPEEVSEDKVVNKVVNRDDKPFEFLGVLSKIVIFFFKFIAAWILFCTACATLGVVVADVIISTLIPANIIFLWITLLLLSGIIIAVQIIALLIHFLFNKKVNVLLHVILFVSCIVLSGVSIGMITVSMKNFEFIDLHELLELEKAELKVNYEDGLVIESNGLGLSNKYTYIIDEEVEEGKIIVSRNIDKRYFKLKKYNSEMDELPVIRIQEEGNADIKSYYDLFVDNLKQNKLVSFNEYSEEPLVIRAKKDTIEKLIKNQKLLYLTSEEKKDNTIKVTTHDEKVFFKNGLYGKYNALEDTIEYSAENYSCVKQIEKTKYGERIIYNCNYLEDED